MEDKGEEEKHDILHSVLANNYLHYKFSVRFLYHPPLLLNPSTPTGTSSKWTTAPTVLIALGLAARGLGANPTPLRPQTWCLDSQESVSN